MILGVGQVSDTCFMILQGEVQVRLDDGTHIETLKPGGVFNYQGFLNTVNEGKESVFEVYAKDNVLLGEINRSELRKLTDKHFEI